MDFGASSYRKEEQLENYKRFTKNVIASDYYEICIKKCIKDFNTGLSGPERVTIT